MRGGAGGRYGRWIADRTRSRIDRIAEIIGELGTFLVLAARKPR